jgi:hypothetical protein
MSEQKPVAEITIYGDIAGIATKENFNNYPSGTLLFTADQLKAEREKVIRDVMIIIDRHCASLANIDMKYEILALLSTDESKENEVKDENNL